MQNVELLKVFITPGSLWDFHWLNTPFKTPTPLLGVRRSKTVHMYLESSWPSLPLVTVIMATITGTRWDGRGQGQVQEGWVVMVRARWTCKDWGRGGDSGSLSLADWSLKQEWEEARTWGIPKWRERQQEATVKLDSGHSWQCWLQQLSSAHRREQESLQSRGLQEGPSEVTEDEGSVGESGWLQIQTGLKSTQPGAMDQGRRSGQSPKEHRQDEEGFRQVWGRER